MCLAKECGGTLKDLDDPDLLRLARELPSTVLQSRAISSSKKYTGAFRRWKLWALDHKLPVFPAKEQHVALHLQYIADVLKSKSAAEEAVHALNWVHSLAGLDSPAQSPLVQTTLEGLRRLLARPVLKKNPVSVDILADLVEDSFKHPTLSNVHLTAACLLAFSGFLRSDELISLRPCDIKISSNMMTVTIRHSKTDQLRKGDEVLIARTSTCTCPVTMLERYMELADIAPSSDSFLFRAVVRTKEGEKLRQSGKLGYSTLRELFKKKLVELGYPAEQFGLHSLRAGGATAAANAGIQDRLFKRHGRWKSDTAKDGYIEDSTDRRLSVSLGIGL